MAAWQSESSTPKRFLTVDGTLSDLNKAIDQIQLAIETGHAVTVLYVYNPVEKAVAWALDRAIRYGRVLPLHRFAETHFNAQSTVFTLIDMEFSAEVEFACSAPVGSKVETVSIETIRPERYESLENVIQRSKVAFEDECNRRQIEGNLVPERIKQAFSQSS